MKFIDFTALQIYKETVDKGDDAFFKDFISEFSNVFCRKKITGDDFSRAAALIDADVTRRNIEKIKSCINDNSQRLSAGLGGIAIPGVIFMAGPAWWDGHGIMINGLAFTFFDMAILNNLMHDPAHTLIPHVFHEIIHSIHYGQKPEFYPANQKTLKEKYLTKILSEGIATYLAGEIFNADDRESLTFGLLDNKLFDKWITRCKLIGEESWNRMQDCFKSGNDDPELWRSLFFIGDEPEVLTGGRFGYYYGLEIARAAAQERGNAKILSMSLSEFEGYIQGYFR